MLHIVVKVSKWTNNFSKVDKPCLHDTLYYTARMFYINIYIYITIFLLFCFSRGEIKSTFNILYHQFTFQKEIVKLNIVLYILILRKQIR